MGGLLAELGKKIAERWLTLLVLPGALYLAVVAAAQILGHKHPFDLARIERQITALHPDTGRVAVGLLVILLAAAAVGTVAQAIGSFTERSWLAADWRNWPAPARFLARRRVARRRARWVAAGERHARQREEAAAERAHAHRAGTEVAPSTRDTLNRTRAAQYRIALEQPEFPTWMGDRLAAAGARLDRDLELHLPTVWPHLWLIAPENVRTEITAARDALSRAASLAAWGLLYLVAGALWWPGLLVAATVFVTGWRRARTATDAYAALVEAATRLHGADLARALGLEPEGPLTPEIGRQVVTLLRGR